MIQNAGNSGGLKVIASGRLTGTPLGSVTFPAPAAFVFVVHVPSIIMVGYVGEVSLLTPGAERTTAYGNPRFSSDGTKLSLTSGATGDTYRVDYIALG